MGLIVRGAGERTEGLCLRTAVTLVGEERTAAVHEHPFTRALTEGFQAALQLGCKWSGFIDADVLPSSSALSHLLRMAATGPQGLFMIQGRVIDRFVGGPWTGGLRLYRTSLLDRALEQVPPHGTSLRPESSVHRSMETLGYTCTQLDDITGIHDYEQFYADILRKMILRARKNGPEMTQYLLDRCTSAGREDADFVVARAGLLVGFASPTGDSLDARTDMDIAKAILVALGIEEKPRIPESLGHVSMADDLLLNYRAPPAYSDFTRIGAGVHTDVQANRPLRVLRSAVAPVGRATSAVGRRLERWAAS